MYQKLTTYTRCTRNCTCGLLSKEGETYQWHVHTAISDHISCALFGYNCQSRWTRTAHASCLRSARPVILRLFFPSEPHQVVLPTIVNISRNTPLRTSCLNGRLSFQTNGEPGHRESGLRHRSILLESYIEHILSRN